MPATGVCKEFLHQEKHEGIVSILFSSSHTWLHFFFDWEDWFQQQALTEVRVRELTLDVKYTKETLAMIDSVSVATYDINQKL